MEEVYLNKPWVKHYDKNVSPNLTYEDKTFAEKFAEAVKLYPDKTAMIYLGRKFYVQGTRRAFQPAGALSH